MNGKPKVPHQELLSEKEKSAITRQVQRRMFWKLIVVVIVVGTYVTLRALETATQSYEDERGRPIVLVGEEVSREYVTIEADAKAVQLGCERLYPASPNTSPKKEPKATLVRMCAAQHLISDPDETTAAVVRKKLGRLENQYFPDEQSIISRLDQDIRAGADMEKRALLSIEEAENRKRASTLLNISKEEALVDDALRKNAASEIARASTSDPDDALHEWINKQPKEGLNASDEEIQNWQKRLVSNGPDQPLETNQLLVLHQTIVGKADYEVHFKLLKKDITKIEDKAQNQLKVVYEKLAPTLGDLVKASPGAPDLPATNEFGAWFHPRSLLDARSGAHVIYETVQLTLAMVLVLGVIFLLFLVLRFLPFFAGSTDQLTEQAKAFLQRSGGTVPPIAKSFVVTASALALGTAVVVAGNKAINPPAHVDPIYDAGYDDGDGKDRRLPGEDARKPPRPPFCPDCGELPPGGGVDVHVVKLEEPIAYPSPITISGPSSLTLTPESIDGVKTVIQELLKSTKVPATVPDTELELRIRTITDKVVTEKLTTVTATCCKAGGDTNFGPDSFTKLIGPTLTTIEIIQKDLDATKKTLAEIQNKDVQPQTDSGGRGIFTRTKQFFKGDKYLVTREIVDALRSLMSKPTDCRSTTTTTDAAKQKCCGDKTIAYCPDSTSVTILDRLQKMIGNPPASESDFMEQLRDSKTRRDQVDKAIDQWKSVILRYARVPY